MPSLQCEMQARWAALAVKLKRLPHSSDFCRTERDEEEPPKRGVSGVGVCKDRRRRTALAEIRALILVHSLQFRPNACCDGCKVRVLYRIVVARAKCKPQILDRTGAFTQLTAEKTFCRTTQYESNCVSTVLCHAWVIFFCVERIHYAVRVN